MSARRQTATVAGVFALLEAGDAVRAERAGRELLKREPRSPDAWHAHALAAFRTGKIDRARAHLEKAIAIRPDSSVFHSNLGAVLERLGDLEGALRSHERALDLDPGPADTWFNHGLMLIRVGRAEAAVSHLRSARDRAPEDPEIRLNLARALERTGDAGSALGEYRSALALATGGGARWADEIRGALRHVLASVFPVEAAADVRRVIVESGVTPELGPAAAAQLRLGAPSVTGGEAGEAAARFLASRGRLLLDYLRSAVNRDPGLERLMVAARAHRLREWTAAGKIEAASRAAGSEGRLAAALATQCFHNEYAWFTGPDEEARLAAPAARLAAVLTGGDPMDPGSVSADLLLVALYRPAGALPGADRLAAVPSESWPPHVADLLRHCLNGPREELEIARDLPSLAEIRDPTSTAVRSQYEENPYPRWISLPAHVGPALGESLARRFPDRPALRAFETVLVAGGGTGYEPLLIALANPDAQVLSLDLSRASLGYGARMARRLGIDNVRFLQADLLDVAMLGETFDAILASGVLHHMADPHAGLRALAGVLRPGGAIRVGLYSAHARDLVSRARAAAHEAGRDGSPAGIRAFRRDVLEGDGGDLEGLLRSADFYSVSTCRDLVFHVHERQFTIPEVGRALAGAGLRLLGFEAQRETRVRYRRRYPADPCMRSLESLAEFEKGHTEAFAGMYLMWAEHESG